MPEDWDDICRAQWQDQALNKNSQEIRLIALQPCKYPGAIVDCRLFRADLYLAMPSRCMSSHVQSIEIF
jgi:hypothetical protein